MPYFYHPYAILLICAVGISAALGITVLKYRPTLGTLSFAVLMGAVCMWSFLSIFEVISYDLPIKQFSGNLKYLFIVTIPVAWFTFSLFYSNRARRLSPRHLALLIIVPALTVLVTATNGYHHLMFQSVEWHRGNNLIIPARHFGPWFWVHTIYSYGLLFIGFLFLARSTVDSQRIYRSQGVSLLIAALAPWLCNMFFLFTGDHSPRLDLTPFAFTISGLAVMWGIVRYRLLDIIPVARDIVIQNMNDGVIVLDSHQRILDLNPAAIELLGSQQPSLIGQPATGALPWWPHLPGTNGLNGTPVAPLNMELEHRNGQRHLHIALSNLIYNEKHLGYLVTLRDATAMKKAQDALRQSEERFKSLSENAPVIIFTLDGTGNITYVNPAWITILGHDRQALLGRQLSALLPEDQREAFGALVAGLIRGQSKIAESTIRFRNKDGEERIFDFSAAVNSDEEGRITGIIGFAKDITEEDHLKAQLFQAQKMEAIGTLAGGVAHDFNNLLMGMQANVSLLRLENESTEQSQEKLTRIEEQIQSGASLTRQLLGYARKGKYVVSAIDVHPLIQETLEVVQRTNKNIRVHYDLKAAPAVLEADRGQMELVFLNLFVNAVDAMPKGGDLTVTTNLVHHPDGAGVWPEKVEPGRYVEIKVTDTGVGMAPAIMERIFEPFFTTKEIGRGTGLGLASVYGVVKNHRGYIRVTSKVGHGTTFVLLFPPATTLTQKAAPAAAQAIVYPQGRYVLLVDDEAPILQYIGEMVHSLGFKVHLAGSGLEAIRLFKANHQEIDFVILDMIMPDTDGWQVFKALKATAPDVKVIIASGYGLSEQSQSILKHGPHIMLPKPFTRSELAEAIAKLLGAR
ncbi:MAG: PAS domain S-box protein [Desulfobacterales bacterium]|nr:PAS domain S-box protein [Desulfobacterales bacterium]